jgi:hypothetical protein
VPGKESYDDWKDVEGLGLVGSASFFPHMEDRWQSLVECRKEELSAGASTIASTGESPALFCLGDFDVCLVEGEKKSTSVLSTEVMV